MRNSTSSLSNYFHTCNGSCGRFLKGLLLFTAIVLFNFTQVQAQDAVQATDNLQVSPDEMIPDVIVGNPYLNTKGSTFSLNKATPIANPDLPSDIGCGDLRVVFILDESGSISPGQTPGAAAAVRSGALQLATSLQSTGAELRVVEFNTHSSIVNLGASAEVTPSFISNFTSYLNSSYNSQSYNPISASPCTGWTNWEDALNDASTLPADLVIFFTDGNPTAYYRSSGDCGDARTPNNNYFSYPTAVDRAITQANVIKGAPSHIFVAAVGDVNLSNIQSISGPDDFAGSGSIYTDDYSIGNFDDLADDLGDLVNAICGTEIEIQKTVSPNPVCPETSVTFTITVENTGGSYNFDAINTVMTDLFPAGFSNFAIVGAPVTGASFSGSTLTYNIGDLVVGSPVSIQVTANAPPSGGSYINTAKANADNATLVSDDATLNVSNITGSKTTETVCDSYYWPVTGENYYASTFLIEESTNSAGCTQRDTLDLTVNYSDVSEFSDEACVEYVWEGTHIHYKW